MRTEIVGMLNTVIKRKYIIVKVAITQAQRFVPFDIKLPSNVVKVKSVLVTATKV
jgi:hypothetical protein